MLSCTIQNVLALTIYLLPFSLPQSENQEDTELKVCNFVESLMENNYDEYGEIKLTSYSFDLTNWNQASEYQKAVAQVSNWQIVGLFFSTTMMVSLFLYATFLYWKVQRIHTRKREQAYPIYLSGSAPKKVFRGPSGITMNRTDTYVDTQCGTLYGAAHA
jgi:predicted ATP-binding protein involved in virulence